MPSHRVIPLTERAWLALLGSESEARGWAAAARAHPWPAGWLEDVVPAYQSVAVYFTHEVLRHWRDIANQLEAIEPGPGPGPTEDSPGRILEIPVLYNGLDLASAAGELGMDAETLIQHHAGTEYHVFAIGFQPGFPYAGYLPEPIQGLARHQTPRPSVPAGSVAIAGMQTGIYPCASPGGWRLLGTTPLVIADLQRGLFPIRTGDRLRFRPISPEEFAATKGRDLQ